MKLNFVDDNDVEIDMSPMIDMVFLLLIFFIVASVVVDLDKPTLDLPSANASKVSEDTTGRMQVSVDRTEQVYVGATPVTLKELKTQLAAELKEDPNIRVYLRADRDVPYGVTSRLMKACTELGALDLIFATFEE